MPTSSRNAWSLSRPNCWQSDTYVTSRVHKFCCVFNKSQGEVFQETGHLAYGTSRAPVAATAPSASIGGPTRGLAPAPVHTPNAVANLKYLLRKHKRIWTSRREVGYLPLGTARSEGPLAARAWHERRSAQ